MPGRAGERGRTRTRTCDRVAAPSLTVERRTRLVGLTFDRDVGPTTTTGQRPVVESLVVRCCAPNEIRESGIGVRYNPRRSHSRPPSIQGPMGSGLNVASSEFVHLSSMTRRQDRSQFARRGANGALVSSGVGFVGHCWNDFCFFNDSGGTRHVNRQIHSANGDKCYQLH